MCCEEITEEILFTFCFDVWPGVDKPPHYPPDYGDFSGIIPICLQASEQKRIWKTKNVYGQTVNVDEAKKQTIQHWRNGKIIR